MTAKDKIHDAVRNALLKDGWAITDDPLTLEYGEIRAFVDLGAERVIAAERQGEKIAVEIKSFIGRSVVNDIEAALGQYVLYRSLLRRIEAERKLFIAISDVAYGTIFERIAIQEIMQENQIPLLIVEIGREEVLKWIEV